jgi:hypothetical protein
VAHTGITHGQHRGRTRQSINDRKLTDDSAPVEERKMRSAPELETIVTLRSPSSTR